jgi:hypothetical protein
MQMILQAADAVSPGRAIVLGAGRCDEIPLAALVEQFGEVSLNDINADLLAQGIAAANLSAVERAKISSTAVDLIGITDALTSECRSVVVKAGDVEHAVADVVAIVGPANPIMPTELIMSTVPISPTVKSFDLIVASCVLSQLTSALIQNVRSMLSDRYSHAAKQIQSHPLLTQAFDKLTRRCETAFVDFLASGVAPSGRIFFSDSVQMCFVRLTNEGNWVTPGTWRMTKTLRLDDYLDGRFQVLKRQRWNWVVNSPQSADDEGRLYDVQAMILKTSPAVQASNVI